MLLDKWNLLRTFWIFGRYLLSSPFNFSTTWHVKYNINVCQWSFLLIRIQRNVRHKLWHSWRSQDFSQSSLLDSCKHLGNTTTNKIDGCQEDLRIKRAKYISKNIEINLEFHFSAADTRIQVNSISNTYFSGSPLWNLFSPGAERFVGSYNRSIKSMMKLPLATSLVSDSKFWDPMNTALGKRQAAAIYLYLVEVLQHHIT